MYFLWFYCTLFSAYTKELARRLPSGCGNYGEEPAREKKHARFAKAAKHAAPLRSFENLSGDPGVGAQSGLRLLAPPAYSEPPTYSPRQSSCASPSLLNRIIEMLLEHFNQLAVVNAIDNVCHPLGFLSKYFEKQMVRSKFGAEPRLIFPLRRRVSEITILIEGPSIDLSGANRSLYIVQQLLRVTAICSYGHRVSLFQSVPGSGLSVLGLLSTTGGAVFFSSNFFPSGWCQVPRRSDQILQWIPLVIERPQECIHVGLSLLDFFNNLVANFCGRKFFGRS